MHTVAIFTFLAVSTAHMIIETPYPYGRDSLTNSPLDPVGADFPCKQRKGVYDPPLLSNPEANKFAAGDILELSFLGSAVHGGGSCQISISPDRYPDKNSAWKVIHSIQGGCPANVDGNLEPENPEGRDAARFSFHIPESISPGLYTLAWTWLNRRGSREFFMNCAPITVTAAKNHRTFPKYTDLPDMFIANINGCMTPEGVDIRFPNPGYSVDFRGNPSNLMQIGTLVCRDATGKGPVAGAARNVSEFSRPTSMLTVNNSPSTTSAFVVTSYSALVNLQKSNRIKEACTEGFWKCIDGMTYQQCASGSWSTPMMMATGTSCIVSTGHELIIDINKPGMENT
ncbi:hypothetical protein EMCG_00241 [[Emmonsia] crescens]|uniref:DNA-directed RNA polymerase n=1 Tax=[Emmonsia] crescens TaxID=73230 RepID=A0A0G2I034_9EURO|nr:hypothetical protein EMCG_00241 [Emmonsia crescens UAMH 3008]